MLISREAANCRRMEAQSGSSADLPIDDRCQHLSFEAPEGRGLSQVKVTIQGTRRSRGGHVDGEDLEDPRHDTSVLAASPSKEELSQPSRFLGDDGADTAHGFLAGVGRTARGHNNFTGRIVMRISRWWRPERRLSISTYRVHSEI